MVHKFDKERKDLKEEIKQQFKAKVDNLELENEQLQKELTATRKKYEEELDCMGLKVNKLQEDKDNELNNIHRRFLFIHQSSWFVFS